MADIRRLHALRFETVNPVIDLVDKCVGEQWLSTPDFWTGGLSDAATITAESSEVFFAIAIYGGLFVHAFDQILYRNSSDLVTTSADVAVAADAVPLLDVDVRLEYLKYCAPDWTSFGMHNAERQGANKLDPRQVKYPEGPYRPDLQSNAQNEMWQTHLGLFHLWDSRRWLAPWDTVREYLERDTGLDVRHSKWKTQLWEEVVLLQGLDGLRLIRHWNKEEEIEKDLKESGSRARLSNYLVQIVAMADEPRAISVDRHSPYEHWPSLTRDLYLCLREYGVSRNRA